jgi:hypothetical protein
MAQIRHRQKSRQSSVDYKDFSVVARDGIEPPTPAFSGLRSIKSILLKQLIQSINFRSKNWV